MQYKITYYSDSVQHDVLALPTTLAAKYITLSRRMMLAGPHLGDPHTKFLGDGLLELRLKGVEGIARVMYCTLVGKRIVMLHSFIKKTQKTPAKDMDIARKRLMEVKDADA